MFEAVFKLSEHGVVHIDLGPSVKPKILFHPEKRIAYLEKEIMLWVEGYLDGQLQQPLPSHVLTNVSLFTRQVVQKMRLITPGNPWSYRQLALSLGKPNAARAVGSACGRNPLPLFYPCHRVIAANGIIGGFSSGLDTKRALLEHEAAALNLA